MHESAQVPAKGGGSVLAVAVHYHVRSVPKCLGARLEKLGPHFADNYLVYLRMYCRLLSTYVGYIVMPLSCSPSFGLRWNIQDIVAKSAPMVFYSVNELLVHRKHHHCHVLAK
jgi:hypothetical protein